jgi:hypothetical protein
MAHEVEPIARNLQHAGAGAMNPDARADEMIELKAMSVHGTNRANRAGLTMSVDRKWLAERQRWRF